MQMNPQEDLIIGWEDPYEEVTITGEYFLDGKIIILNQGRLNLLDADFKLKGDIVVADSGRFNIQGGTFTVLAEYLYQYSITSVGNSVVSFDSTEISINGQSWNVAFMENSRFTVHDTHFKDGITAGLLGNAEVDILRSNPFEWVIFDNATVNVSQGGPHIFWFAFPDSSKASLSFPDGGFVTHFSISENDSISGIGYSFDMDSTVDVWWGLILQEGSDVTVRDSFLRTTGIMAEEGDSLEITGLVNDQYYEDFTAPISDRSFNLINTTLETWNVYPWGIQKLSLNNSIIGELGTAESTETTVEYSMVDGSGGYVFTGGSSFTRFFISSVSSHIISRGRSVQLHYFSSMLMGDIIATDASMMVFIHSLSEQIPEARDTSLIVEMAVMSPEDAFVGRSVPIVGTAVVSGGPVFPIDLHSYRLDYGIGNDPEEWIQIGSVHTEEVRNDVLEIWNTHGLEPGEYVLRMNVFLSEKDSLEAYRWVSLGESTGEPVIGDVNGDGEINVLDVVRVVDIILEMDPPPTEYEFWAADCNGDSTINVLDVVGIVGIILGDGSCLPTRNVY